MRALPSFSSTTASRTNSLAGATLSLSTMATRPLALAIVALIASLRSSLNDSRFSTSAQSSTSTRTVVSVSPGAKTRVPLRGM
jgi:hypothetical protein